MMVRITGGLIATGERATEDDDFPMFDRGAPHNNSTPWVEGRPESRPEADESRVTRLP